VKSGWRISLYDVIRKNKRRIIRNYCEVLFGVLKLIKVLDIVDECKEELKFE
jgi:hypothetical protein